MCFMLRLPSLSGMTAIAVSVTALNIEIFKIVFYEQILGETKRIIPSLLFQFVQIVAFCKMQNITYLCNGTLWMPITNGRHFKVLQLTWFQFVFLALSQGSAGGIERKQHVLTV